MRPRIRVLSLIAALAVWSLACGGGGETEANRVRPGSSEWYWEGVMENMDAGAFEKALEHLNTLAKEEGDFKKRAILYRTMLLVGLAKGNMEFGDALRSAIEEKDKFAKIYETIEQQVNRDARQAAIDLAESLREVDQAFAGGLTFDFPFPQGSPSESNVAVAIANGEEVPQAQVPVALEHTIRRNILLAAAELSGHGEDAAAAKAAFDAGPVNVDEDKARMAMAKLLLDVSLVFDRKRVNEPDIRKILIDQAEQWAKRFAESENEEHKAWYAEFSKEIEDERRDMEGKARRVKKRS